MGSVLTPILEGLPQSKDLPHACTLNGQCQEVCPVAIPLPTLLRGWRERLWSFGVESVSVRQGFALWRFLALRPALYRRASGLAVRIMRWFARDGWIARMPLASGWTRYRDLPRPPRRTFIAQYRRGMRRP
jgi:L-lactate dehydrogenase complex protein LldF